MSQPHKSVDVDVYDIYCFLLFVTHKINSIVKNSFRFEYVSKGSWNSFLEHGIFGKVLGRVFQVFVSIKELQIFTIFVVDGIVDFVKHLFKSVVDFMDSVRIFYHLLN
jgi:hypothetical protein